MLSKASTYGSAFAACGVLFMLVPPAGLLMACVVMANLADEWSTSPPEQRVVEIERDDGCACSCHAHMGNDFWFLPMGSCLNGKCDGRSPER